MGDSKKWSSSSCKTHARLRSSPCGKGKSHLQTQHAESQGAARSSLPADQPRVISSSIHFLSALSSSLHLSLQHQASFIPPTPTFPRVWRTSFCLFIVPPWTSCISPHHPFATTNLQLPAQNLSVGLRKHQVFTPEVAELLGSPKKPHFLPKESSPKHKVRV